MQWRSWAGRALRGWRPTAVGLVSFALVFLGLLLGATVDMAWLALLAAGCFGPGLLRELHVLRDCDEFQRQSSVRAGYHAYLAGGLLLAIVIIARSWGRRDLGVVDTIPASLVLTCMLVTYALSSLTRFWGPRAAAVRILMIFGLFWLFFVVLSHAGEPVSLLFELALPGSFFGLAFLSRRWPRPVGAILIAFGVGMFFVTDMRKGFTGDRGRLYTLFVLLLPVLYTGLGLLGARDDQRRDGGAAGPPGGIPAPRGGEEAAAAP